LLKNATFEEVVPKLEGLVAAESAHTLGVLAARANSLPTESEMTLVANRLVTESQIDSGTTYFVNGVLPWIGKGESEFALSGDQTLTTAKATAEPKVLETLLAMVPVKDKLLQRWDLVGEGSTDTKASTDSANMQLARFGQGQPLTEERPVPANAKTRLVLEIVPDPEPIAYRLRKRLDLASTAVGKPLSINDLESGSVQLVEVAVTDAKKLGEGGGDAGKVKFAGQIELPKGVTGGSETPPKPAK
jgi:hypothetical protein